jgi:hypothetical protein
MRTFVFLCCLVALSVNPIKGFSQDATIEIITTDSLSIENIFSLIKANTDYQFIYNYDLIKNAPKVAVNKGRISVKDLLKKGLDVISFTYVFKDNKTIIVKTKQGSTDDRNQQNNAALKTVNGQITFLGDPLPNVNIIIRGTRTGTETDTLGNYTIKAKIGDVIQISHVGFKTISIVVEDITAVLNIEMKDKTNKLDEVVITAKSKTYKMTDAEKLKGKPFKTAVGLFKPEAFGYTYFDNKDNLGHYASFTEAWNNIYFGAPNRDLPAVWDVDGIIYYDEPAIDLTQIIDIYVINKIGSTRWGGNGAVIVRTNHGFSKEIREARIKDSTEKYINQNYYNEDAVATQSKSTFSSSSLIKDISGKVTHLLAPIPNVNITIKGTSKGTKTNDKGEYHIQANVGDILEYSHVSYTTVAIMIEDVTATLNIELQDKDNKLDEVVVKARVDQKALEYEKKMNVDLKTSFGTFNPKKSGFSINYIPGSDLNQAALSIAEALNGKAAGLTLIGTELFFQNDPFRRAIYVVDGQEINSPSLINLNDIEDVYAVTIKNLIIIRTANSFDVLAEKKQDVAEQYQNQNYYNNDAVTTNDEAMFSSANITTKQPKYIVTKNIHGKVTYLDAPMPLVNIKIVGKYTGVKTSPDGTYNLEANVGDIIQYSHIGFATVSIIVEDITEVLNIEMVLHENELETVVVTADGKLGITAERAKKAEESFETSRGKIDPKKVGYAMSFVDGEDIKPIYKSLTEALNGKTAGVRIDESGKLIVKPISSINTPKYPLWDVDGNIYDEEPPTINVDNVKSVRIIKTLAGTNRYGSAGAGGVIVVQTKNGDFNPQDAKRNKIAEQYTNKDYYANDALQVNLEDLNANAYADAIEAFNNKQKAFIYYDQTLKDNLKNYSDHISIAQKFISFYSDKNIAHEILYKLSLSYHNNPEILKVIAYHLQAFSLKRDAINVYKQLYTLRPKYVQSYRDLANAFMENNQYKKAWRLYMSYLMQGNDVSGEGIGQLLYNEMEWLYFNRSYQTDIKERFVPKSDGIKDFRNDVRIVFEWNTSEAEFDLEFVNPEKRAYSFKHSLADNQELITSEKQKGYASKEFFIDDIGNGEWLINISYKGNKKPEPTYFKVTKYYNWSKSNQTLDITVYKFQNQREKMQLMKLNKQSLVVSN